MFGFAACGDSKPGAPTAPSADGRPVSGLTASLSVTIDSLGSQQALAAVSDVTIDARGSAGSRLSYRIDFGDGATSTDAVARHVYASAGTYNVGLIVTDGNGRTATATQVLVVASPLGAWVYSGYIGRTPHVEIRTLTLTAQDGLAVRGVLARAGVPDSSVTGSFTPDRRIRIVVDDPPETLEGAVPSVLIGDGVRWPLVARGPLLDGDTLAFTRRPGDPTGPPPDGALKLRFSSFNAPFAVKQISPVLFDGSTSRGDGLSYYIEFGDHSLATTPTAVHTIENSGQYVARLTVVDRFGRSDIEEARFEARSLVTDGYYVEWTENVQRPCSTSPYVSCLGWLTINSQVGINITGTLIREFCCVPLRVEELESASFTGTASDNGEIRLKFNGSDVALIGTMDFHGRISGFDTALALKYVGGPHNGEVLTYWFRNGY
jgi:PKD repeat protein